MNLSGEQLKDTYGNLVTTGTSAGSPTEGGLQNGDGQLLTSVGIGTNLPASGGANTQNVHIHNPTANSTFLKLSTSGTGSSSSDGLDLAIDNSGNGYFINRENANIHFYTNGDEKLRIEADGDIAFYDDANNQGLFWDASTARLGIGNQAPTVALDVTGDIALSNDLYISNGNFIKLQRNSGGLYLDVLGTPSGTDDVRLLTSGAFDLVNGSLTSMLKVDSSGNVGIGETDPDSRLHLKSASAELLELERTSVGAYRLAISASDAFSIYDVGQDSDRLIIDTSGKVGIGVSPSAKLHVNDTTYPTLRLSTATSYSNIYHDGTTGSIAYSADDGNAIAGSSHQFYVDGSSAMTIDSSGAVGIGTQTVLGSANRLHVKVDDSNTDFSLGTPWHLLIENDNTGTNTGAMLGLRANNADGGIALHYNGAQNSGYMTFHVDAGGGVNGERMRIDSSGQVHINGATSVTTAMSGDNIAPKLIVEDDLATGIGILRQDTSIASGNSLGSFGFYGTDTTSNTPTPLASMQAVASGTHSAGDNPTELRFFVTPDGSSTMDEAMRLDASGNVLVGTTSSSGSGASSGKAVIQFNGAVENGIYIDDTRTASGTDNAVIFGRGATFVGKISTTTSSTAYETSSDYRLKENVVPMEGALDRVAQLKPSRFNFIADADTIVDGFLAHEVSEIVPEAITGEKDAVDDEGNPIYQGIDQSKLVPLLVGAIQELRAEIEQLKNQ